MSPLLLPTLLPCVVAPLAALALLAFARPATRLEAAAAIAAVGLALATLAGAGLWLPWSWWLPVAYLVGWAALAVRTWRRAAARPGIGTDFGARTRGAIAVTVAAAFAGLFAWSLAGRSAGDVPTVSLGFPLRDGTYAVVNGGSTELLNAHLFTLAPRFAAWRGQSYGYDLVRVNALGLRARTPVPRSLDDYLVYGATVHAPCAGRVLASRDDLPDQVPPRRDRSVLTGNFVLLDCGVAWVVLGHLQPGTVAVRAGDAVEAGRPLGRVGNSGNTDEPHLHVHAQRPGRLESAFAAEPLLIAFDGRVHGRNALLRR